ncbi:TnpV protein [Parablautia muri]|uniref:TnpV protein n=2 Tax=Lachnospiraceae TaxID=186803 RepID=A0A9X5GTZ4_9FIRM|nr:TnpV protein [Parablautia muri]NBJ95573.1 TnpV protein [Parablautia muri]
MDKLKKHIYDENNGLHYTLVGDYYIPDLKLPEENRTIGRYGRLHREYLKQEHPARYSSLILTGKLWTYLADLNEQAEERLDLIMEQMKAAEGVTEELKARNQLEWVGRMNNIRNRAEKIIKSEMIYL